MKKLILLMTALLITGTAVSAKEVVKAPITEKEAMKKPEEQPTKSQSFMMAFGMQEGTSTSNTTEASATAAMATAATFSVQGMNPQFTPYSYSK